MKNKALKNVDLKKFVLSNLSKILIVLFSFSGYPQENDWQKEVNDSAKLEKLCKAIINVEGSNYKKAVELFDLGFELNKKVKINRFNFFLYRNLAIVLFNAENFKSSQEAAVKALKYANELGNDLYIGQAYTTIGNSYLYTEQNLKAREYYRLSLKYLNHTDNYTSRASGNNNLAITFDNTQQYDSSLKYYFIAYDLYKESKNEENIVLCLMNIGDTYQMKGDLKLALRYQLMVISRQIKIRDSITLINTYAGISDTYRRLKLYDKAIESLRNAEFLANKFDRKRDKTNIYLGYKKLYTDLNKPALALSYFEKYVLLKDTIMNEDLIKNMNEVNTKYEVEKKENQIQLLNANQKIKDIEINKSKQQRKYLIGAILLFVLIASVLYFAFVNKRKANEKLARLNNEIEESRKEISEKNREIIDSINYAKRIQYTLLAHDQFLKENLPEHFVFFNPKDIVSGDFYWATKHNGKFYMAVCDSTGHGVPGAFMSLLNIGFLSEAINEKCIEKPNEIFDYVRMKLTDSISKEGQKDGFDGILLCIDSKNNTVTYAAANSSPVLVKGTQLHELPKDRMPVGVGDKKELFTLHKLDLQKGDILYLYTDGYADQFGGPSGKKLKYKQLNELLLSLHTKTLTEQKSTLASYFENWKGKLEQIDDVCVIGIRF